MNKNRAVFFHYDPHAAYLKTTKFGKFGWFCSESAWIQWTERFSSAGHVTGNQF